MASTGGQSGYLPLYQPYGLRVESTAAGVKAVSRRARPGCLLNSYPRPPQGLPRIPPQLPVPICDSDSKVKDISWDD